MSARTKCGRRPVRHVGARGATVAVLTLAAACHAHPEPFNGRPGDVSPSPSSTRGHETGLPTAGGSRTTSAAVEAAEAAAAAAAYTRFWRVSRTFDRRYPQRSWRHVLGEVAADPALSLVLAQATAQARNRITLYGTVVPHPTVTLRGGARAGVRDCQDASRAGQADAVTGRRRTVGVARNPITAALALGADGRWRVASVDFPGGSC